MNKMIKFAFVSTLALTIQSVSAHGAWLAERVNQPTIIYGHGASDDAYKPEKVTFVKGFSADNQAVNVKKINALKNVSLKLTDDVTYVGFILDNGYWSKNGNGKWENLPKNEVSGATEGGHYLKNSIAVLTKDAKVEAIPELNLQIIPLANPLKKKAGDKIEVLVLFNGKPLADAKVINDYQNASHEHGGKTNKEGKVALTIRNQGLNVFATSHTEPLTGNEKADENGYFATLSFTLPHLDHD